LTAARSAERSSCEWSEPVVVGRFDGRNSEHDRHKLFVAAGRRFVFETFEFDQTLFKRRRKEFVYGNVFRRYFGRLAVQFFQVCSL
jgi:hypothetical protein